MGHPAFEKDVFIPFRIGILALVDCHIIHEWRRVLARLASCGKFENRGASILGKGVFGVCDKSATNGFLKVRELQASDIFSKVYLCSPIAAKVEVWARLMNRESRKFNRFIFESLTSSDSSPHRGERMTQSMKPIA